VKKVITAALVSHSPFIHGAERMLLNLARLLRRTSDAIRPVLIIPGLGEMASEARACGVEYELVPPLPWYLFGEIGAGNYHGEVVTSTESLKRVFTELVADVVVVNTLTNVPPALAALELGLPFILWVHGVIDSGLLTSRDSNFALAHDQWLLQSAGAVVFNSNWTRRFFHEMLGYDAGKVIHNWTHIDRALATRHRSFAKARFVCMNTFDETKGYRTLLRASALLKQKGLDFEIELYGEGREKKSVQDLNTRLGLGDIVHFKGRTTQTASVYEDSLCVVNPSYIESFGMTLIEGMAQKTPVIATRSGGPEEIIEDGECGFLVPVGDEMALAERMELLLRDMDQATQLGEQGYLRVKEMFSEEVAEPKFIRIINNISHSRLGRGRQGSDQSGVYRLFLNAGSSGQRFDAGERATQMGFAAIRDAVPTIPPLGYASVGGGVEYRLVPVSNGWMGLDVLALVLPGSAQGQLRLRVLTSQGCEIREASMSLDGLSGESWLRFRFSPIENSRDQEFRLRFTEHGLRLKTAVVIREASPLEGIHRRLLRRVRIPLRGGSIYCKQCFNS